MILRANRQTPPPVRNGIPTFAKKNTTILRKNFVNGLLQRGHVDCCPDSDF